MSWSIYCVLRRTAKCYPSVKQLRPLYSRTGELDKKYTTELAKEIEAHWKPEIEYMDKHMNVNDTQQISFATEKEKEKFYVLSMFPYPSGSLHMGHIRVYTISDIMARYQRLRQKKVFHPMGWDAFGLPAENAAIERGIDTKTWTESNIKSMKQQLNQMMFSFNWDTELKTCDTQYYRWTQHIFLQMYEAGLAYQKEAAVNWDPVDQTVLANEQINDGRSWRSGALVEKRYLKQWYLKTTAYAKALYDGLDSIDTSFWKDTATLQKNWIGECNGCEFNFQMQKGGLSFDEEPLSVFTESPELIYGASHIAISHNHRFNNPENFKNPEDDNKDDFCLTVYAVHPFTGDHLPVVVSKTTEFDIHNDTHIGIPDMCDVDKQVAEKLQLTSVNVLIEDKLTNSEQFSGLDRQEAKEHITKYAREHNFGGHICSSKLKDWLISRQRYWGTPIPIIHCPNCKAVPVPYNQLPVELPRLPEVTEKGRSPLSQVCDWYNVTCPRCGQPATRETDTMDTFVDSSWYFLRYLDPKNENVPFKSETAKTLMPVDLYIGGKEHAVMHLYFARFFTHFLYDKGQVPHKEPFLNLLTQGMVMGQSYKVENTAKYISQDEVDFTGDKPRERSTGLSVITAWEKMSKSKYNGADPQEVIEKYGVDTTRLCIVYNVAPKTHRRWSDSNFIGVLNWQSRLWYLVIDFTKLRSSPPPPKPEQIVMEKEETNITNKKDQAIRRVMLQLEKTYMLNAACTELQILTNELKKVAKDVQAHSLVFERAILDLVIMMSPFVPAYASELWNILTDDKEIRSRQYIRGGSKVLEQNWPHVSQTYMLPLFLIVNGKRLFTEKMPRAELDSLTEKSAIVKLRNSSHVPEIFYSDNLKFLGFSLSLGLQASVNYSLPVTKAKKAKKNKKKAVQGAEGNKDPK